MLCVLGEGLEGPAGENVCTVEDQQLWRIFWHRCVKDGLQTFAPLMLFWAPGHAAPAITARARQLLGVLQAKQVFPVQREAEKGLKVKAAQFSLLSTGPGPDSNEPKVRHSEPAAKVAATLSAGGTCASLLCLGALTTFQVEYCSNRRGRCTVTLLKTFCSGEC